MKVTITRRSKLGFGYNTQPKNNDGYPEIESTNMPDYVGTIKQVVNMIDIDKTFQSVKSGGTWYTTAWFVKISGHWYKLDFSNTWKVPGQLLDKYPDGNGKWVYIDDSLDFDAEKVKV